MSRYRVLVAGMSHVGALEQGWLDLASALPDVEAMFLDLRSTSDFADFLAEYELQAQSADAVVLMLRGNEHTVVALANVGTVAEASRRLDADVRSGMDALLDRLLPLAKGRVVMLPPPPPIEDIAPVFERKRALRPPAKSAALSETRRLLDKHGLRPPQDRLALWRHQCGILSDIAAERGVELLGLPATVYSKSGMLSPDCCGDTDLTHGNRVYGRVVFGRVLDVLSAPRVPRGDARPPGHPYEGLANHAYWRQAVGDVQPDSINPVVATRFPISVEDRIATAGSCFAQHLSSRLRSHGFNFMDAEDAASGPYPFSARYGNVYTSRQLLQLFQRAFGSFTPGEVAWRRPDGRYCDAFRPRIPDEGHPDEQSVRDASRLHLEAVRRMFLELDVFVFTLGLTECWAARSDGAVYPVAPGVMAGTFDPARHVFVNLHHDEVKRDMQEFLHSLWSVNRHARVLLTVSPVPMVATREDRHVLVSNTESKSVLRSVAGDLARGDRRVDYFPAYELIAGPHSRGRYFAADSRTVTDVGVDHVMRVFLDTFGPAIEAMDDPTKGSGEAAAYGVLQAATDALCDEESYASGARPARR